MIHQTGNMPQKGCSDAPDDAGGLAALLIDGERRLLDASAGASVLLDEASVLECSFGRLVACRHGDGVLIERALDQARRAGTETVGLDRDRLALDIVRMGIDRSKPNYLLIARPAAISTHKIAEDASRRFGLTLAESRLLIHLLDGLALKEAAARLAVANTTARTHLQRIFDKTGVRRQTDLQRMMAIGVRGRTLAC